MWIHFCLWQSYLAWLHCNALITLYGSWKVFLEVSPHLTLLLCSFPGSKAMDYSNGLFDCQSPTSPFLGGLRVLHLLEDLRGALELMDNEERDNLRCQIPDSTAEGVAEWLHGRLVYSIFTKLVFGFVNSMNMFCVMTNLNWCVCWPIGA